MKIGPWMPATATMAEMIRFDERVGLLPRPHRFCPARG